MELGNRYVESGSHDWEIMLHEPEFRWIDAGKGKKLPIRIEPQFNDLNKAFIDEILIYKIYYSLSGNAEIFYGDMLFNLESCWMFQGHHLTEDQQIQICARIYQLPLD